MKGEKYPPEVIVSPTSMIYPEHEMELDVFNTLVCFVNNFHPPEVGITWTRNGQLVNQSEISQTQYYSNSISSYLDFKTENMYEILTDINNTSASVAVLTQSANVDPHQNI